MTTLQQQARAFLERPIPAELAPHYVPDSFTDRLLAYYAGEGALDDEGYELAGLCALEADDAADRHTTDEAKQFFRDCQDLLNALLAQAS